MAVLLPPLRVGQPLMHGGLSVFPIFAEGHGQAEYRLSEEALADQSVLVGEVSEGGSVPVLLVENRGDRRVLFLEGEELVGAKQNRVLNTSVLVGAHTKLTIPVSCVERGRWRSESRYFGSSGSHSPHKLRRALKASVSQSIRETRSHTSDQSEVWRQVDALHQTHGIASDSSAMSDAFDSFQERIRAYTANLPYVDGAAGLAIAVGGRVLSVDVFDQPATCRKVWARLLTGVAFDAMEAPPDSRSVTTADVEAFLTTAATLPWQQSPTVGEGQEFRAASPHGDHASALLLEGAVIHESVVAGQM